jgi:predicted DNA-binding transcriptional regulator YafY
MKAGRYLTAREIAAELQVSKAQAYRIIGGLCTLEPDAS